MWEPTLQNNISENLSSREEHNVDTDYDLTYIGNPDDFANSYKFSAAVAGFAQLLRGGENLSTMNKKDIIELAQQGRGEDLHGYRGEFINMVKLAQALSPQLSANNAVGHK